MISLHRVRMLQYDWTTKETLLLQRYIVEILETFAHKNTVRKTGVRFPASSLMFAIISLQMTQCLEQTASFHFFNVLHLPAGAADSAPWTLSV